MGLIESHSLRGGDAAHSWGRKARGRGHTSPSAFLCLVLRVGGGKTDGAVHTKNIEHMGRKGKGGGGKSKWRKKGKRLSKYASSNQHL